MWLGDNIDKPVGEEREKLLAQKKDIERQIRELKAKPLPQGDRQQMERFRTRDLTELASKIVKINKKLGIK